MSLQAIRKAMESLKNPEKAKATMRFFKCEPGKYGEGDEFMGLTNPECRQIAKTNKNLSEEDIEELLTWKYHEERSVAPMIMVERAKKKDELKPMYELYLRNLKAINNWDLVDISAPHIIGTYILENASGFAEITDKKDPRNNLYLWVKSPVLWERRISILSTWPMIKAGHFWDTLKISKMLLGDKEDLMHKAVGWMLR